MSSETAEQKLEKVKALVAQLAHEIEECRAVLKREKREVIGA